MEKQILFVDSQKANGVRNIVAQLENNVKEVINGFNALNIGALKGIDELLGLIDRPLLFVKNRLVDVKQGDHVNGLKLNRSKVLELMEVSSDVNSFVTVVQGVNAANSTLLTQAKKEYGFYFELGSFELQNNTLSRSKMLAASLKNVGVYYAQNENQLLVYNKMKEVFKLMGEIYDKVPSERIHGKTYIYPDPYMLLVDGKIIPNHHYIIEHVK